MKILHSIGQLVNVYFDYLARARTVAELSQLTDDQLKDIGLARHELHEKLTEMWAKENDAAMSKTEADKAVLVEAVKKPKKDLSTQLLSLYSAWDRDRPGYIV